MPKLLLIDAMASLYRSYFAMAKMSLTSPRGQNVAALYGFVNTMLSLLEREKPDLVAICTDSAEPTFRHQAFAAYKATRESMPDDLQAQIPLLYSLLTEMRIPLLQAPGFEADDIIATLAQRASQANLETVVVSGDKDLNQLLTLPSVRMISPSRMASGSWSEVTIDSVKEKFGVPPEQLGDWLAMVGDTSDNIPGIPKIGGKSATELLTQFGSLDAILSRVSEIEKKSWNETIAANIDQARLSRQLVALCFEAPAPSELSQLTYGPFEGDRLRDLLNELGFRSLLNRVLVSTPQTNQETRDYQTVNSFSKLDEVLHELPQFDLVALDTETTGIDPNRAILVGISLSVRPRLGWFIHLPSFEGHITHSTLITDSDNLFAATELTEYPAQQPVLDQLRNWLTDPTRKKCGQNFKYDHIVFARAGVEVQGWVADSMLMSYLLDPNSRSHGIDLLSSKYLQLPKIPTQALIGSGKNQRTMAEVPVDQITEYACEDADYTLRLTRLLSERLESEQLKSLHDEIECPLAKVLARMEMTGISIDQSILAELAKQFASEMMSVEADVHKLAGHPFNLSSPLQLSKVLFEELGLKPVRKTKTGFSTDEDVLEKLALQDSTVPIPKLVLRYRGLAKLRGTYVEALPKLINPKTGRIHTSYNQAVASTGRLSSTDPNLQNIPVRTAEGAKIRTAFVAGYSGWKILSADYSQIELRLMAQLSGDITLREAFAQGHDIHAITAAKVFGIPLAEVTREQRSSAKGVNFGIIYGQTDFGLSEALAIPLAEAKKFREQYFATYPGVRTYMDRTVDFARKHGYVITLLGRKKPMPEMHSDNRAMREFSERVSINAPIQGTAADIIKLAMIRIDAKLQEWKAQKGFRANMLLQVHDELVFEVPPEEVDELSTMVCYEMEHALELDVPIVADIGVGNNWLEAH